MKSKKKFNDIILVLKDKFYDDILNNIDPEPFFVLEKNIYNEFYKMTSKRQLLKEI